MTTWHIPLRGLGAPFGELVDFTFPPGRYLPLAYDWPLSALLYSDDEGRTNRHNVSPYALLSRKKSENSKGEDHGFKVQLSVKHYKPDEINLKVEGQTLTVQGKHENQSENGFERSEFSRQYTFPEDVDPKTLSSKITPDGVLCIEAAKIPKSLPPLSQEVNKADGNLKFAVDVSGYKPDEISVKVVGRSLIIRGEARKESGEGDNQLLHHEQFTRQMTIPDDVDISSLSTRYSKEGRVIVEAPRLKLPALAERELELKIDAQEEKMQEQRKDSPKSDS